MGIAAKFSPRRALRYFRIFHGVYDEFWDKTRSNRWPDWPRKTKSRGRVEGTSRPLFLLLERRLATGRVLGGSQASWGGRGGDGAARGGERREERENGEGREAVGMREEEEEKRKRVDLIQPVRFNSGDVIEFTAEELKGYIREGKIVGRGAFGPVYKGIIKGRQERNINGEHVAIKFSRNKCESASTQWRAEKDYLPEVKHQNIIKLIGYCESEERFYLVYPFMQNGTALSQLSGLDWHKTLKIIKGVASAIQKLQGFTPALVRRDIKLDNILLDQVN
ncbi:serine/threonine-protein kinase RIPK-like [Hevea brasiliensis]|uniref:serine/threonine-protein kinase RIPK-like n=1 Tax=Hevea brasiliensis TaxID=3981 RepID=UPI0025D99A03|nr:serine/threonine-protein kinase RIPK-like [Hevea brasiliensis]